MNEHLRKIKDKETYMHYLGKDMQNEIIQIISDAVKKKMLDFVSVVKYFSIITDCTPDIAHTEQMSIEMRFVDTTNNKVSINEHFLEFVDLQSTTGESMANEIICFLENVSLPIQNLRGQGYDNASNMKGDIKGVQRRILNINPRATYVPCSSHSLNLVVDCTANSLDATVFFDTIHRLYVYFSGSTRRWEYLKEHITNFTLKPVCDTRWES
jgi:hypothetical protein